MSLEREQRRLVRAGDLLDSLSPLKVVSRGYSLVTENGKLIKNATQLKTGATVNIQFATGTVEAEVKTINP